ncbi:MAG: hypothetical protein HEP71_29150 [Roseivirga sp.]|nr:hypothetical protein [Roseivirga sp.]
MKLFKKEVWIIPLLFFTLGCEDEIRNIAANEGPVEEPTEFSPEVNPVDINIDGFDLLENMQGHWTGSMRIIADDLDWFAFDYRPVSSSHIFGIFEGGSAGDLLTSFFVTDFKDKRTIMARNGGLLNGLYRTSYFVLDSIRYDNDNSKYYRLVDARGGAATMFMELRFKRDSLYFNAYTSRLGLNLVPTRHMTFKAKRENPDLALAAAQYVGFPLNEPARDFSRGFSTEYLYVNPGDTEARSATFLAEQGANDDIFSLADASGDPFRIQDHPYLSFLTVNIERNQEINGKPWFVYLSRESLTDTDGYLKEASFGSVFRFPEILSEYDSFTFTYLHPGNYFVTVIADVNEDGFISAGDITHRSRWITINPEEATAITIDGINVRN